jgi:hypothetical protein
VRAASVKQLDSVQSAGPVTYRAGLPTAQLNCVELQAERTPCGCETGKETAEEIECSRNGSRWH